MAFGKLMSHAGALRVLSIVFGVFMLFMGISKLGWLTDTSVLQGRFEEWLGMAPARSRWYLEWIAIPGVAVFARIIPIAEIATATALITGFRIRLAATLALLMVLNFHFASDVLLHYEYLTNGYGLPVVGSLLALMIGGAKLPLTISKS